MQIFKALVVLGALAFGLAEIAAANAAECQFKFQNCGASASIPTTPTTRIITDENRIRRGDLYDPKTDGRIQIRDNARRIRGYILPGRNCD